MDPVPEGGSGLSSAEAEGPAPAAFWEQYRLPVLGRRGQGECTGLPVSGAKAPRDGETERVAKPIGAKT
jgi:hypothetical protein